MGLTGLAIVALFLIVSACGSAKGGTERTSADDGRMIGINVAGIQGGSRVFMNLIYGSSWMMRDAAGAYAEVPVNLLDANGWVKSLPAGSRVIRDLSVPLSAGNFVCRYQGKGVLEVSGAAVSNVAASPGATSFSLAATYPKPQAATLTYSVDPVDYIRNIDCREVGGPPSDVIASEFLSFLSKFKTIRFMKWQVATEGNWPVTWATRNKPGDGDYTKNDGVPIEVMVDAANRAGSDLWVTVPWNADDDYATRFATYVRDNLSANHHVYVEVSNEVWNGGYGVARQAASEAQAEGLASGTGGGASGNLERYAEKTKQVMVTWTTVFRGKDARLVRVASWQHVSPYFSDLLLKYMDLSRSVDAFATAPYFGYDATSAMSLDQIMSALPGEATAAVETAVQQKAIAQKHGLRFIAYEAGQSVVLRDNVPLEEKVQRDPRMRDAYEQFITEWNSKIGDDLNLFALDGEIGPYGGWGLTEYVGQPLSQTPKLSAVEDFVASNKPRR